jgi:hypothetical protein
LFPLFDHADGDCVQSAPPAELRLGQSGLDS